MSDCTECAKRLEIITTLAKMLVDADIAIDAARSILATLDAMATDLELGVVVSEDFWLLAEKRKILRSALVDLEKKPGPELEEVGS